MAIFIAHPDVHPGAICTAGQSDLALIGATFEER
jgi:hypothetical protein